MYRSLSSHLGQSPISASWAKCTLASACVALSCVSGTPATWAVEWRQQAKLQADDRAPWDSFGNSVSISGDTVIVGAPFDDQRSGSAYIFERSDSGWTQSAKLLPDDGAVGDWFGSSVSISGDMAIVGAPADDELHESWGWAYVFQQGDSGWTQVAKLAPRCGSFGVSVAISGRTAIVGAPGPEEEEYGPCPPSTYIFKETPSGWIEVAKLRPDDGWDRDSFGRSVAISGRTVLVGAGNDDDNGLHSGSAYIFKESDSDWTQVAKLLPADGDPGDGFGLSVSVSGATAIVGARGDDDNGSGAGSAYIFEKTDFEWLEVAKLLPSDGDRGDLFGNAVSISGATAVVGALLDDEDGSQPGSAYIFEKTNSEWLETANLLAREDEWGTLMGWSVSIDGAAAIAGAPGYGDSGSGYVFVVPEPPTIDLILAAALSVLLFPAVRRGTASGRCPRSDRKDPRLASSSLIER